MSKQTQKAALLVTVVCATLLTACSTTQKSIATGGGLGAAMGAGVGALADPGPKGKYRIRNIVIGTAAGAAVGAGTGYALDRYGHDEREDGKKEGKKEAEEEAMKRNQGGSGGGNPQLVSPKTEAKWIPDQVRGNTFVPGHFEYVIIEQAHWEVSR